MLDMCRAAAIRDRTISHLKKGQDPDPRDPHQVCIEEGIEPHPGPLIEIRKTETKADLKSAATKKNRPAYFGKLQTLVCIATLGQLTYAHAFAPNDRQTPAASVKKPLAANGARGENSFLQPHAGSSAIDHICFEVGRKADFERCGSRRNKGQGKIPERRCGISAPDHSCVASGLKKGEREKFSTEQIKYAACLGLVLLLCGLSWLVIARQDRNTENKVKEDRNEALNDQKCRQGRTLRPARRCSEKQPRKKDPRRTRDTARRKRANKGGLEARTAHDSQKIKEDLPPEIRQKFKIINKKLRQTQGSSHL